MAAPAGQGGGGNGATEVVETVVKDERENIGRNDPCWCGSGQEVQEVPRGLTAVPAGFHLTFSVERGCADASMRSAKKYKTFHPYRDGRH